MNSYFQPDPPKQNMQNEAQPVYPSREQQAEDLRRTLDTLTAYWKDLELATTIRGAKAIVMPELPRTPDLKLSVVQLGPDEFASFTGAVPDEAYGYLRILQFREEA